MADAFLRCEGITKSFYGNKVLSQVTLSVCAGTVMALVGENGAGKSTLMNIICGALTPNEGTLYVEGQTVSFQQPMQARARGIAFVHQELSLFSHLTVAENIMIGREPRRGKMWLDPKGCEQSAREILRMLEFDIDASRIVEGLLPAEKQMVEIAKAYSEALKLLILDEPTSSLNKAEAEKLFAFVRRMRARGVSVIFITHRMDEIFEIADEVVVLKDGKITMQAGIEGLTKQSIVTAMVGRETSQVFPPRATRAETPCLLRLERAGLGDKLHDIDLQVCAGKVLGIGGLEGQGQWELARALFGIKPFDAGTVYMDEKPVQIRNPKAAIRLGISYIPDDRKVEGLVLPLGTRQNMTMLVLRKLARCTWIYKRRECAMVAEDIQTLDIRAADADMPVMYMSGGNQQKVVFAKWRRADPRVILLHEPTRGIDVNAKFKIYQIIRDMAAQGVGVVLFTSDMLELIGLSDQIAVIYQGAVQGCIDAAGATEESIMAMSTGLAQAAPAAERGEGDA